MTNRPQRTVVNLENLGSENWFESLGDEIPSFEEVCEIVGKRFVAFAFVAGVQIISIAYNQADPESSEVGFKIDDDDEVQNLSLKQFRELVSEALLSTSDLPLEIPATAEPEEIAHAIGNQYLLLAPIFGVRVIDFSFGGVELPTLTVQVDGDAEEITVQAFRNLLRDGVRATLANTRSAAPFSIDFRRIPQAETANRANNFDQTIALLGTWPGPLSLFIRTAQGQGLGTAEKGTLSHAMGLLGEAYLAKGQRETAEDVLRLGIQWGQDAISTAELFITLADARLLDESPGEAIGMLRRALTLGADKQIVLPKLARAFAKCKRFVAAAVCLDELVPNETNSQYLEDARTEVGRALGRNWNGLKDRLQSKNTGH
jgi:hypothetical protein